MKLLVSVRSVDEALTAAAAGADFIDLKEPHAGALGALPLHSVRAIVAALRTHASPRMLSATVGDDASADLARLRARVTATAACGVDYVKVGVLPGEDDALAALADLAAQGLSIVPVFIADQGLDAGLVEAACQAPFPALMLDTAAKQGGSLLQRLPHETLSRFVSRSRAAGKLCGLAGALRMEDLPPLIALAPDFAGFRSAVCSGGREGPLEGPRVRALCDALQVPRAEAA